MGRGVTAKSAALYMLYHQNSCAQVKVASRRRAASQIFSPPTSALFCRHSQTSANSRKYQPLATHPCSLGRSPVVNVAWTEQVTAGVIVLSGLQTPRSANRLR